MKYSKVFVMSISFPLEEDNCTEIELNVIFFPKFKPCCCQNSKQRHSANQAQLHDISMGTTNPVICWNMLHLCYWFSIDISLIKYIITHFIFLIITKEQLKWLGAIIVYLTLMNEIFILILHNLKETCPSVYKYVYAYVH